MEDEEEEFVTKFKRVIDHEDVKDADNDIINEIGIEDPCLNMELGIRHDDKEGMHQARVKRRAFDQEGRPVGRPHNNLLLDHRQYEVEFLYGKTEIMTANIIAENLLAQVDDDGHQHLLIDEIEDHRFEEIAVTKCEGTYTTGSGLHRNKLTTRVWEFYFRWKDGSGDWIDMKYLKDSYLVPLADHAVANDIQEEPDFSWWVPFTLKKRISIIKKIKSKYIQRTHKYGIRVTKSVKEAQEVDTQNGNTLWMDSIRLEMTNNRIAFETYEGDVKDLVGYEEITGN